MNWRLLAYILVHTAMKLVSSALYWAIHGLEMMGIKQVMKPLKTTSPKIGGKAAGRDFPSKVGSMFHPTVRQIFQRYFDSGSLRSRISKLKLKTGAITSKCGFRFAITWGFSAESQQYVSASYFSERNLQFLVNSSFFGQSVK